MGKWRTLNGLANNLVESFLSMLNYYDSGHMAHWISKRAQRMGYSNIKMDIINVQTDPEGFMNDTLAIACNRLSRIIQRALEVNNFELNYIQSAIIQMKLKIEPGDQNHLEVEATLVLKEGRTIKSRRRKEKIYAISDELLNKLEARLVK